MAKKISSLQEVFVDQLKDLYSAETQITKALPKLAKAATAPDLKKGFELHLEQTRSCGAHRLHLRRAGRKANRQEVHGHRRPGRGRAGSHR